MKPAHFLMLITSLCSISPAAMASPAFFPKVLTVMHCTEKNAAGVPHSIEILQMEGNSWLTGFFGLGPITRENTVESIDLDVKWGHGSETKNIFTDSNTTGANFSLIVDRPEKGERKATLGKLRMNSQSGKLRFEMDCTLY